MTVPCASMGIVSLVLGYNLIRRCYKLIRAVELVEVFVEERFFWDLR